VGYENSDYIICIAQQQWQKPKHMVYIVSKIITIRQTSRNNSNLDTNTEAREIRINVKKLQMSQQNG
jgi:hypothetical protein